MINENELRIKMHKEMEEAGVPFIEKNGEKVFVIDEQNPDSVRIYRKYWDMVQALKIKHE